MNFKALFCGIAAAAMFTACSNDEPNGGNTPETGGELSDGGYITVGINLPKQAAGGMHARQRVTTNDKNDQFDHGLANEYAVNNAMLLVFTGAEADGEGAAKFHSAYDLTMLPGGVNGPTNRPDLPDANITTTYLKTVHLNNISDTDYLWGLVLVNYDGIVSDIEKFTTTVENPKPDDIFPGLINKMKVDGNDLNKGSEITFKTIQGWISENSFINSGVDGKGYFFMTNAVVSTADADAATASTVYTLQKIGKAIDVTKPTEAEAQAYPAASFYVERAVAKATLVAESASTTGDLKANNITINTVEWVLDNTEPSSYIVRNVGDNSYIGHQQSGKDKRFVGTVKIGTTALQPIADLYRHYWAIDPQYNKPATLTTAVGEGSMTNEDFYKTHGNDYFKASGSANPQYCHENTFNVAEMTHQNTTRALLKVTFNLPEGNDGYLYTVNNLQSTGNIFCTQDAATTNVVKAIVESHDLRDAVKAALQDGKTVSITTENYKTYFNIDYKVDFKTNIVSVNGITFIPNPDIYREGTVPAPFTGESNLVKNVNASFQVVRYDGGVAYYEIRFKHFGDEYTPWLRGSLGNSMQSTAEAYDGNENDYLGRWGMVRNNWYEINLNSIKQLGMPVIGQLDVTTDDTPDDDKLVEKWLSFKINILSWAKRVQTEDI